MHFIIDSFDDDVSDSPATCCDGSSSSPSCVDDGIMPLFCVLASSYLLPVFIVYRIFSIMSISSSSSRIYFILFYFIIFL